MQGVVSMENMTETEKLIGQINESAAIMTEVDKNEDVVIANEEKLRKGEKWILVVIVSLLLSMLFGYLAVSIGEPLVGIILIVVFAAILALQIRSRMNRKKKITDLTAKNNELTNNPVLAWLPMDYRNGYDFFKIAEYVQNQRANTLQEAINLLEREKHERRVEIYAATSLGR